MELDIGDLAIIDDGSDDSGLLVVVVQVFKWSNAPQFYLVERVSGELFNNPITLGIKARMFTPDALMPI